jgi:hypothetical protein
MASPLSDIWLPSSLSNADVVADRMRRAGTPEGMRDRMHAELVRRLPLVSKLDDYYEGRHAFSFSTVGFQEHAKMLAAVSDNWMPLICRASAERLGIEGFKLSADERSPGDEDPYAGDFTAWDIWRRSDLDEHSPMAWLDAIKLGEAYWLAEVVGERNGRPDVRITIEHPASMVIARAAGDPSRATAALKAWTDEWGVDHCTLWTTSMIYRWVRMGRSEWVPAANPDEAQEANRFGPLIPVVPIVNDPQTLQARPPQVLVSPPHSIDQYLSVGHGRSDQLDVIETQDATNKLVRDMLIASEYQSFRQRWVSGFIPEIDETTKRPINPFKPGPGNLWVAKDGETSFGEFNEASLEPFLKAIEGRVQSMASRTSTPPHYFLGQAGVFPSGETIRATEAGLSSKTKSKQKPFGGSTRRLMAVVLPITNPELEGVRVDPDWKDPEVRTESEHMDSLVKKLAIGVPVRQLWEDAGYSPEQIARFKGWIREQAADAFSMDLLNPAAAAAPGELSTAVADVGAGPSPTPVPGT